MSPVKQSEWKKRETLGVCPECGGIPLSLDPTGHHAHCRKYWYDRGYSTGFHDGSNRLPRHDDAFVVELCERNELDPDA